VARAFIPGDDGSAGAAAHPLVKVNRFTDWRARKMMRTMSSTGESIGRLDIAIGVALSALGLLLMYGNATDADVDASWLAMPVFLGVTIPLLWRRAAPLQAMVAVAVALAVHIALFGSVVRCGVVFPVVGVLVFSVAARFERTTALWAFAGGLAIIVGMGAADETGFGVVSVLVPLTIVAFALGRVAYARGRMVSELKDRTQELRAARDERARLEVATDRTRLSGELDALLARRLGELTRLADAGPAIAGDGAAATATLAQIEEASRATLEEMREIVGVLRDDDAPTSPVPTLTSLRALVLRDKGDAARLTVEGSPRVLPAGVELSAYRIVEHLLSALDDAPGVEVGVRFGDDALEIRVAGPAGRRGDVGAALGRARERAQLHRGTLDARTRGGRAEAVALLPVAATA
jgi:signal transduction histidine kinase